MIEGLSYRNARPAARINGVCLAYELTCANRKGAPVCASDSVGRSPQKTTYFFFFLVFEVSLEAAVVNTGLVSFGLAPVST